jgi:tetratricopeptide (TPR) repeat protein
MSDKTDIALNKISNLLKEESFSTKNKTSLKQYYINGLLSVGDTSKALLLMRENIEALSGDKKTKAAIQLAKIARLVGDSTNLEYALSFVTDSLRQKPKTSIIDSFADYDYFEYEDRKLIGFLREIKFHGIPQKFLIRSIGKKIKKIENDLKENKAIYYFDIRPYLIELMGVYYDLGRWEDIKLFMDNFSYWGVNNISTIVNEKDSRKIPLGMILAKALAETGDAKSATKILKKVIRNNAGYDPAYELYMDINGAQAATFFSSAYELDQFEERPLIWQAQVYFNTGDYKEAKKTIKKAISIDPSDGEQGAGDRMRAYSILADVLEKEGDTENVTLYHNAIKAIRLSEQADKYNELGLYSIAIDKYREATKLFTDAYCIQSRLAIQLTKQGQHEAASKHYKKAFELMPDSFGRIESHCFGCENIFDHPNAQTLAESVFEDIINKRPNNAQAQYMLGYLRKKQHQYDAAIESFRKAVALDPEYLNSWKRLYQVGQKSYLPGWENEIALLKMFELDPLQRHSDLNFTTITDLKKLWHVAEMAHKHSQDSIDSIYALAASQKTLSVTMEEHESEMENYYRYAYSKDSEPLAPAAVLMRTDIILGAVELMMEPNLDDVPFH